jgi:hypothetical protein
MMKPILVLLPGLLCDAALWSHQRTNLWGLAEIVIPDLSGGDDIAQLASSVLAFTGSFQLGRPVDGRICGPGDSESGARAD